MDLTPPTHLRRPKPTPAQTAATAEACRNQETAKRTWAPIKSLAECQRRESLSSLSARFEAADMPPGQPVSVRKPSSIGQGADEITRYPDWTAYEAAHDAKTYPVKRVQSIDGVTVVLVAPKPWAGKIKAVPGIDEPTPPTRAQLKRANGPSGKAKLIGEMLLKGNVSSKELCEAVGWPSMSVPAQAKMVGLTLRKEKVDGVMRYWGSRS